MTSILLVVPFLSKSYEIPFQLKDLAENKLPSNKQMTVDWPETLQGVRKMLRRYSQFVSKSIDHSKEIEQLSVKVKEVFKKLNATNIAKFRYSLVKIRHVYHC